MAAGRVQREKNRTPKLNCNPRVLLSTLTPTSHAWCVHGCFLSAQASCHPCVSRAAPRTTIVLVAASSISSYQGPQERPVRPRPASDSQ